jgi:hypothetical protein
LRVHFIERRSGHMSREQLDIGQIVR